MEIKKEGDMFLEILMDPSMFSLLYTAMAESMQQQTLITTRLDLRPRTVWALW